MSTPSLSGAEIKRRREAAGLSQESLAVRAGLSLFTLSKIERGGRDPRFSTVALIADALGCHVDDLTLRAA